MTTLYGIAYQGYYTRKGNTYTAGSDGSITVTDTSDIGDLVRNGCSSTSAGPTGATGSRGTQGPAGGAPGQSSSPTHRPGATNSPTAYCCPLVPASKVPVVNHWPQQAAFESDTGRWASASGTAESALQRAFNRGAGKQQVTWEVATQLADGGRVRLG